MLDPEDDLFVLNISFHFLSNVARTLSAGLRVSAPQVHF